MTAHQPEWAQVEGDDSPAHALATDHGRFYSDPAGPGRLLVSVTNVLNQLAIDALAPAAAKVTAEWFAEHLPDALRAAADPGELAAFVRQAKAAYREQWEKRRELGSRVHRQARAVNLGAPIAPDPEAEPFVDSYRQWLADFGVDIERDVIAAECTMLHRDAGYAGTSDLWVRLRFDGPTSPLVPRYRPRSLPPDPLPTSSGLWLVDIKTSLKHPASTVWEDYPLQLAALRNAPVALVCPPQCRYGTAADCHEPDHEIPTPPFDGVAILNLRTTAYGFIPLPADEAAFAAFRGLQPVTDYVHHLDRRPFKPIQPPTLKEAS
ncbi:hypothetical protein [Nonomuraea wenchangensis]|uniref:Uncharacterized protein n=1 Tax=Nonomuraea wenchangensis TaxID=568860 RepID=A0A1I0LY41_9ACTN|nr:hypothetical protein [Nonomuraea wenchangensis]SEU47845.1 hypothetical protein SAMN05421811_13222 [Nonomuraea wenchangensis]